MGKVTDWFKVATAGKSIDGRTIKDQWLLDMAATYSATEYTALIWPEHYRWFNCGLVAAVKAEKDDQGRLSLYCKLEPNDNLLTYNEAGQKLFTSIEVTENYAKTGKTYLTGLAITDSPASLGTERLAFSTNGTPSEKLYSEPVEIGAITIPEPSRLEKLLSKIPGLSADHHSLKPEESDTMTKEQFEAMLAAISAQTASNEALAAKFTELSDKVAPAPVTPAPAAPAPNTPPAPAAPAATFSADDMKAIQDSLASTTTALAALQEEFTKLRETPAPGTQTPAATGTKTTVC